MMRGVVQRMRYVVERNKARKLATHFHVSDQFETLREDVMFEISLLKPENKKKVQSKLEFKKVHYE